MFVRKLKDAIFLLTRTRNVTDYPIEFSQVLLEVILPNVILVIRDARSAKSSLGLCFHAASHIVKVDLPGVLHVWSEAKSLSPCPCAKI